MGGGGRGGGGGRAPCCDKSKVKKGPWSPAEDVRLVSFIQKHGHTNWRSLPKQAGLLRCGKSCRLRWINYLRPDVKRGNFTPEEEQTIIHLHCSYGNKWSKIASQLPGRTDNEIKNVWNTHLKKRSQLMNNVNKNESLVGLGTPESPAPSSSASSVSLNGFRNQENSCLPEHDQMSQEKEEAAVPTLMEQGAGAMIKLKDLVSSPSSTVSCNSEPNPIRGFNNIVGPQDHEEIDTNINILEIPLESEVEFWNMLDDMQPHAQPQLIGGDDRRQPNNNPQMVSDGGGKLAEEMMEVDEYRKWVRFLEDELGLVGGESQVVVEQAHDQTTKLENTQQKTSKDDGGGWYDPGSWCRMSDEEYCPLWPVDSGF